MKITKEIIPEEDQVMCDSIENVKMNIDFDVWYDWNCGEWTTWDKTSTKVPPAFGKNKRKAVIHIFEKYLDYLLKEWGLKGVIKEVEEEDSEVWVTRAKASLEEAIKDYNDKNRVVINDEQVRKFKVTDAPGGKEEWRIYDPSIGYFDIFLIPVKDGWQAGACNGRLGVNPILWEQIIESSIDDGIDGIEFNPNVVVYTKTKEQAIEGVKELVIRQHEIAKKVLESLRGSSKGMEKSNNKPKVPEKLEHDFQTGREITEFLKNKKLKANDNQTKGE